MSALPLFSARRAPVPASGKAFASSLLRSRRSHATAPKATVWPFFVALMMLLVGLGAAPATAQTISVNPQPVMAVEGDNLIFTLTRTGETAPRTVTYSFTDNSATGGPTNTNPADYNDTPGSVVFPQDATTVNVTVPTFGDTRDEINENFFIKFDSPGAQFENGVKDAEGIILDNDGPTVSIAATNSPITEGNSGTTSANFRISLSQPSAQDVTVRYATANGTANAGTDYVAKNATVTIPAGQSFADVFVLVNGELIDENDETFSVTLSIDGSDSLFASIGGQNTATATITDDDNAPTVGFFPAGSQSINEGNSGQSSFLPFTVRLSQPSSKPVTVLYATSNGTATAGEDYVANSGTLTFNPGQQEQKISVRVIGDDKVGEGNETFFLTLSAPTNATLSTDSQNIGIILDDDTPPSLTVAAQPPSVTEGGNLVFVISLDRPALKTVTFMYRTLDGTAVEGNDYTGSQNQTATIGVGESSTAIPISTLADSISEASETFSLEVFGASNAIISGGSAQAQGTIRDGNGTPVISFVDPMPRITEGNSASVNLSFQLSLNKTSSQPITVTYNTSNGSAVADKDFTSTSGTATIPANTPANTVGATINVAVIGDTIAEFTETFSLDIDNSTNATIGTPQATGSITDNDTDPTLNINSVSVVEGQPATFTVSLTGNNTEKPVTVNYNTVDGSAKNPVDYTLASSSATLLNGERTKLFSINTFDDRVAEQTETFTVTTSADNALGSPTGTGTITDNEAVPQLSISAVSSATEADDVNTTVPMTFRVSLTGPSENAITFEVRTSPLAGLPNSPNQAAAPGEDYNEPAATGTILAGMLSVEIVVPVRNDNVYEGNERFNVLIYSPQNAVIAAGNGVGVGTIIDDDVDLAPKIAIEDVTVAENVTGGTVTVKVSLSAKSARPTVVDYTTQSNTAAAGTDFTATSRRLMFNAGETEKTITVAIRDDNFFEQTENFNINLTPIAGVNSDAGDLQNVITITDNDFGAPTFSSNAPFAPAKGFQSYSGINGTDVTITGTNFIKGATTVTFGIGNLVAGAQKVSTVVTVVDDKSLTARVPDGAYSGRIQIKTTQGTNVQTVTTVEPFYVQPVITGFSDISDGDRRGVALVDIFRVTGLHFQDPLNGSTSNTVIYIGDVPSVVDTGGYTKVINDTTIEFKIPRGATSAQLSIFTTNGGRGPASVDSLLIDEFRTGGVAFGPTPIISYSVLEAEDIPTRTNGATDPAAIVRTLRLAPARQQDTTNPGKAIAPTQPISVQVAISPSAVTPPRYPTITLRNRTTGATVNDVQSAIIVFPAGQAGLSTIYDVFLTYSGDDVEKGLQTLTTTATIVDNEADPFYTTEASPATLTDYRRDLHAVVVETSTVRRTSELGTTDPNGRGVAEFDVGLTGIDQSPTFGIKNRNGSVNEDTRPKRDVLINLVAKNDPVAGGPQPGSTPEGLISYYVLDQDNDGPGPDVANGLVAIQPIPQAQQLFLYAISTSSNEYYRNRHIAKVTGVNDDAFDGDQKYTITAETVFSQDSEYNNIPFGDPVTLVNTDDETNDMQTGQPGFEFSRLSEITTNESGSTDIFTVRLKTQPTANVNLKLDSRDITEGKLVDPATGAPVQTLVLTFTPTGTNSGPKSTRWDVRQTVTIKGQDDSIQDGDQPYLIETTNTSNDPTYNQINPADVSAINQDNELPGATVSPTFLLVDEGSTKTFSVVLNLQPTSDVVINLRSDNSAAGTVDKSRLIFTPTNWNMPQTVTVSSNDNDVINDDVQFKIVLDNAISSDSKYNGRDIQDVEVTSLNNDIPGVTVTPTSGLTTTEAGGQATFTVRLNTRPTADVVIGLTSDNVKEGTVIPSSLTFTSANYDEPQVVAVTGINDQIVDGSVIYHVVTRSATSTDTGYNGFNASDVTLANTDDDLVGVTITPSTRLVTSESGAKATFTVKLNSQPTANVTISLSSSNTAEGTVSPALLTFTAANFATAQIVTVTGKEDDGTIDGNIAYSIITSATQSSDPKYNGLAVADPQVVNNDNDSFGVKITPTTGLITNESGGIARFTLALTARPAQNVMIPLSSSKMSEGTVSPTSVTFTPANYSTAQTVTVTGVNDNIADGNQFYSIITGNLVSSDPNFNGKVVPDVAVTNVDNDNAQIVVSPVIIRTREGGAATTFNVNLSSQPTAGNVVINFTSSNTAEGTIAPASLTFTASNFSSPQIVTVTPKDDLVRDGDIQFTVRGTVQTTAPEYKNQVAPVVTVNNRDNEVSSVIVTPESLVITEGGTATFTLQLASRPLQNVTVALSKSNTTEGTISAASVTFTPSNYATPQSIRVAVPENGVVEGTRTFTVVTGATQSTNPLYNNVVVPDVSVSVRDNDRAGVSVSTTRGVTSEDGTTFTFGIALTSRPAANVNISLASSLPSEAVVTPTALTFSSTNYATAQVVTVKGVDDKSVDGNVTYQVTFAVSSSDSSYNASPVAPVVGVNNDNDVASITVSPLSGLVTTEAGGTARFTVALTSKPAANVVIGLSSSDATEGKVTPATLTFTSANYNVAQSVLVTGLDDTAVDGSIGYQIITGATQSSDSIYNGRVVADVAVTNQDNDSAPSGGTGGTQQADYAVIGKTYAISLPFTDSSTSTSSTTAAKAFTVPPVAADGKKNYTLRRFNAITQQYEELGNSSIIRRGEGYLIIPVSNGTSIKRPSEDITRTATGVTTFPVVLRNNSSIDQNDLNNGLNFIGFPFDPAKFTKAMWLSSQVRAKDGYLFNSVTEAAQGVSGAGGHAPVMDSRLFTLDESEQNAGQLIDVTNIGLVPFEGYYARTIEDGVTVYLKVP